METVLVELKGGNQGDRSDVSMVPGRKSYGKLSCPAGERYLRTPNRSRDPPANVSLGRGVDDSTEAYNIK